MHGQDHDDLTTTASTTSLIIEELPRPIQPRDFAETPLKKLTIGLLRTYKHINEIYYEAKRKRQAQQEAAKSSSAAAAQNPSSNSGAATTQQTTGPTNDGHDDENHDYVIIAEEKLNGRYVIKCRIGKGSFGVVTKAWDETTETFVAIKIIKSKKPFFKQAQVEIELLKLLNDNDEEDQNCVVRLLDTFEHHKHQCLVFEMLSFNLYDLLRNTGFKGVSLDLIRKFARQILKALAFLAQPDIDVIHCDLKPENILLRHPRRSAIKVIDFGSSCRANHTTYTYIQSRFYRSPEVMLGCPYTCAIDMWSLGCILVEMHTGEPLFAGSDERDQMHLLVAARGMPPEEMLKQGKKSKTFFECVESQPASQQQQQQQDDVMMTGKDSPSSTNRTSSPRQFWRLKPIPRNAPSSSSSSTSSRLPQRGQPPARLEYVLGVESNSTAGPFLRRRTEVGHSIHVYRAFIDLVDKMIRYNPSERITPRNALLHPFITEALTDTSSSTTRVRPPPPPQISRSSTGDTVALPVRPGSC